MTEQHDHSGISTDKLIEDAAGSDGLGEHEHFPASRHVYGTHIDSDPAASRAGDQITPADVTSAQAVLQRVDLRTR